MTLSEILRDSEYKLTQFNLVDIQDLEKQIEVIESNNKQTPYIQCLVRGKAIKLTPEEVIRQLFLKILMEDFGYPVSRIAVEYEVSFGREKKRADIVVFDKVKHGPLHYCRA